ncbi:hypothetical protein [Azospirillum doebereinerae]
MPYQANRMPTRRRLITPCFSRDFPAMPREVPDSAGHWESFA